MKQQITTEQFNSLTAKQQHKLNAWILKLPTDRVKDARTEGPHAGKMYTMVLPQESYLLSIGQMIEFLRKDNIVTIYSDVVILGINERFSYTELCDGLWDAVKETLNK